MSDLIAYLIAYLNKPALKAFLLDELAEHRRLDRIVQRHGYWAGGKGCAVGCTLEAVSRFNGNAERVTNFSKHALYEPELGIPQVLARLEDGIFERLPRDIALAWPSRFAEAIKVGADLTMVWPRFALWLLADELPQFVKRPQTKAALADVTALYREWVETTNKPKRERWIEARHVVRAADADAAAYVAAAYAAYADADAIAAVAAAANAIADAAAAADADADADAIAAAYAAARRQARVRQADKLIELLSAAPVVS